jgi:hypothetical protein
MRGGGIRYVYVKEWRGDVDDDEGGIEFHV